MFDIDCEEDSFCDILVENGIETFTFDIPFTNHDDVFKTTKHIIEENNVQNIMGYSYGCVTAMQYAQRNKIGTLILLDPFSHGIKVPKIELNNKLEFHRESIAELIEKQTSMNETMRRAYLESLDEVFYAPKYPIATTRRVRSAFMSEFFLSSLQCDDVLVIFTGEPDEQAKRAYEKFNTQFYPNASHWILLEDNRKQLCKALSAVLK
jgi:pimeloyl-ACP methyl ester carboxylesterase